MSTREGYHHGHLRSSLIDAAVELASRTGPAGVVMRAVTRQVGVSPNAAYRHFADRDALLAAVAQRAMRELVAAMARREAAVPSDGDPQQRAVERLAAIGRGYVDFALTQPGLFRVCFAAPLGLNPTAQDATALDPNAQDPTAQDPTVPDTSVQDADPLGVLTRALDELVDVGWLDPARRPRAEVLCWSAVHGFASLHLDGPLADSPEPDREAALSAILAYVSRGLGPMEPPHPPAAGVRERTRDGVRG